ncbi:MAG: Maleylacetoacetate isomerase [Labilithrix sp.]|nr:Maleylacetoacetate isomerase [Labilithrix sp.]
MAKLTLSTYWRSSCSFRVRIALGYKKLAYEPVFVNIVEGEQKKPEYLTKNPIGHVPTLTVDGVSYVESVAIMELLEELHPEPALLPKTPHDRARVRGLVETINAGIQPLQNLIVLERAGGTDQEKRTAWMKFFIPRGLAAFEALASDSGPYAFGEHFTMADVCLVPQVYAARRVGVDLTPFPRIVRAEAAASALPFVAAAKPEAQPDAKI